MTGALAGGLLGKTSLNSLYGLMGAATNCATVFGNPDSADIHDLWRRRMNKIVAICEFSASCRTPGALASRGRILAHAESVGRPPRLSGTTPRNHGGASLSPGTIGQDRGADRRQHGGRGVLDLRAAHRQHTGTL